MIDIELIEKELEKDIDDLYLELGVIMMATHEFRIPARRSDYIQIAKQWIKDRLPEIKTKICQDNRVQTLMTSEKIADRVILVSSIMDLIATITIGVPSLTVSVLLVKEGINTLCENFYDR